VAGGSHSKLISQELGVGQLGKPEGWDYSVKKNHLQANGKKAQGKIMNPKRVVSDRGKSGAIAPEKEKGDEI